MRRMKSARSACCAAVLLATLAIGVPAWAQVMSPAAETSATIAGKKIEIKYSSPRMRGRKIMGGLVPFGQVWRTGADSATIMSTEANLLIGTLKVPKGNYTIYTIRSPPSGR